MLYAPPPLRSCLVGLPIFLPAGSSAQLIAGLLVCFISYGMYASYQPYVEHSDDWLSKVCQVSLFFSLVSSIALKMEPDSSADALGMLLLITLAVPPVTAFLFESDLDFEKGCRISKLKNSMLRCFDTCVGRHIRSIFEQPSRPSDLHRSWSNARVGPATPRPLARLIGQLANDVKVEDALGEEVAHGGEDREREGDEEGARQEQ